MATVPTVFVQDAPTKCQGVSFKLSPNQFRKFPGGPVGFHRKQIVITNGDADNWLYVAMSEDENSSQLKVITIFTRSSITLFTGGDIILYSGGSTINPVQVFETFYTGAGNLVV